MLYAIMIFITEVWSGLCKLNSKEFWPNSMRPYFSYVPTHIYIADMLTKEVSKCTVTSERSMLVKIANSNVMPMLRGFRWYPYFGAQE